MGKLDPVSGTFTGESDVYALAGYLRGRVRTRALPAILVTVITKGLSEACRLPQCVLSSNFARQQKRILIGSVEQLQLHKLFDVLLGKTI